MLVTKSSDKNPSLTKNSGILDRQTPITSTLQKCCKIFLINFRWHLSCLQNFILQHCKILLSCSTFFYSVRAQIYMCTLQLLVFDVSEKMPFESNDIKEASTANPILIIPPKNIKVLNALDTIWQCLQCEGADMDTFFCLKKQLQESM